jgi:hypothetical protein
VREHNGYLQDDLTDEAFLEKRTQRDAVLNELKLLHQSLQVHVRVGRLPKPSSGGKRSSCFFCDLAMPSGGLLESFLVRTHF